MERNNVIVFLKDGEAPEVFGNFKKLCDIKELPYHSLKAKKFPIFYKEYSIYKVEFQ